MPTIIISQYNQPKIVNTPNQVLYILENKKDKDVRYITNKVWNSSFSQTSNFEKDKSYIYVDYIPIMCVDLETLQDNYIATYPSTLVKRGTNIPSKRLDLKYHEPEGYDVNPGNIADFPSLVAWLAKMTESLMTHATDESAKLGKSLVGKLEKVEDAITINVRKANDILDGANEQYKIMEQMKDSLHHAVESNGAVIFETDNMSKQVNALGDKTDSIANVVSGLSTNGDRALNAIEEVDKKIDTMSSKLQDKLSTTSISEQPDLDYFLFCKRNLPQIKLNGTGVVRMRKDQSGLRYYTTANKVIPDVHNLVTYDSAEVKIDSVVIRINEYLAFVDVKQEDYKDGMVVAYTGNILPIILN